MSAYRPASLEALLQEASAKEQSYADFLDRLLSEEVEASSPCAVGTPLVESLTGFVSRLAVARHLPSSAIFDRLVRPLVREGVVQQSLQLTSFLASGAVTYDGLGPSAEELVGALSRLTGLPRLSHLTLLPWRGFLSVRSGALRWRRPKRWCCRCLAGAVAARSCGSLCCGGSPWSSGVRSIAFRSRSCAPGATDARAWFPRSFRSVTAASAGTRSRLMILFVGTRQRVCAWMFRLGGNGGLPSPWVACWRRSASSRGPAVPGASRSFWTTLSIGASTAQSTRLLSISTSGGAQSRSG